MGGRRGLVLVSFFVTGMVAMATTGVPVVSPGGAGVNTVLIDDFSASVSALGTRWEGFTDRVMGGVSDMSSGIASEEGRRHLYLRGTVSLDNNGGFIQVRLPVGKGGRGSFDASAFKGIRIVARAPLVSGGGPGDADAGKAGDGEGGAGSESGDGGYYLFARTSGNVFPWSFHAAKLKVQSSWTELFVPWSAFERGDFGSMFALNPGRLTSIAVVAYKKAFVASIDVRELSFYQ